MTEILPVLFYGALILGVLVLVHELGHFLVAKWLGVRVISFSIGMGPRVIGFTRGGTDYRISALPLGGFVRMAGDTPEAEDRSGAPDEFLSKPWWARALITAAGPGANLVFALILNMIVFMTGFEGRDLATHVASVKPGSAAARVGLEARDRMVSLGGKPAASISQLDQAAEDAVKSKAPVVLEVDRSGATVALPMTPTQIPSFTDGIDWYMGTTVGDVLIGYPAYEAGLREKDEILSIDGTPMRTWSELATTLRSKPGATRSLLIRRGDSTFPLRVKTTPEGTVGISPSETLTYRQTYSVPQAIALGFQQTFWVTGQIYSGLWSFATNPVRLHSTIAGPIAIAQVARQQAKGGVQQLVTFGTFISLALMVMNLLPIPILDGGHILFAVIEGFRKKPLSIKTQLSFQKVGLFVLIGLVVFAFYNDVSRVTQRKRAEADISKRLRPAAPADTAVPVPGR
jgi:regulator of sigma E protease